MLFSLRLSPFSLLTLSPSSSFSLSFPVYILYYMLPYFITISNGNPDKSEIIAAGNERVIRARLAAAQFFYKADCSEHLESYLPQLENVTFQQDLGSMRDKVDRIMEIAQHISNQLNLN